MNSNNISKRIAFFIDTYPIERSSPIINAVISFVKVGYSVDVFLNQNIHVELAPLNKEQVNIYNLCDTPEKKKLKTKLGIPILIEKIPRRLKQLLYMLRYKANVTYWKQLFTEDDRYLIIPKRVIDAAKNIVSQREYCCFIGVNPAGLLFASFIGLEIGIPVIYYNLEIYLSYDSTNYLMQINNFRVLKKWERKYHKAALATIIQDEERARLLLEDNKVPSSPILLVPVSQLGDRIDKKTDYLFKRLNIPREKRIILHLGAIVPGMYAIEIAEAAQKLPDEWVVVFHGPTGGDNIIDEIKKVNKNKKVYTSTDLIPFDELPNLVSSAEIGLAFYKNISLNDFNTGSSSGKLANYLQCGLPVITINFPSFTRVIEKYQCGICVDHPTDINLALKQITADYERFRINAFRCYKDRYEFSRHFQKVIDLVENDILPQHTPEQYRSLPAGYMQKKF